MRSIPVFGILTTLVLSSESEHRRELRYLDYYLGIKPLNNGQLAIKESALHRYISNSSELDCYLNDSCAWENANTDGLLDTSDFYLFIKSDDKAFPIQVQPGDPNPPPGSLFLLAGNTTSAAQSAIFVSAPVACQRSQGRFDFKYWLYSGALLEVVLLKPPNPQRRQLQVLLRPAINCNILRPRNDICRVSIPEMNEPFRIGIRAFRLQDESVGSFAMISDIEYRADVCLETSFSRIFGGRLVPAVLWHDIVATASEYSCMDFNVNCRWSSTLAASSEWRVSNHLKKWDEVIGLRTRPLGTFFYQFVDTMAEKPYSLLRSDLIPCTSTVSSLSFRYWLGPGTQVQICSVTALNIVISCVYLSEADSPGPVTVDVDAPSEDPFRFVFEVIEFDRSKGGLFVVDDLQYSGKLCNEPITPPTTTINPPVVSNLFALQTAPDGVKEYSASLSCDFEADFCAQWESDGKWEYGVTPSNDLFELPKFIEGNVAVALLDGVDSATLTSRLVPCAKNAVVTVAYYRSEHAKLRICIEERCVVAGNSSGHLAIHIESWRSFRIKIIVKSSVSAIAVIRRIEAKGHICPIPSPNQMACGLLKCDFSGQLCAYSSESSRSDGPKFELFEGQPGVKCVINGSAERAILRSPRFELTRPVDVEIMLYQPTFGSQTFLCGDGNESFDRCQLLLGPKIEVPKVLPIRFRLDIEVRQIAFVMFHDKFLQFGPATFTLFSVKVFDERGEPIC